MTFMPKCTVVMTQWEGRDSTVDSGHGTTPVGGHVGGGDTLVDGDDTLLDVDETLVSGDDTLVGEDDTTH